MIPPCVERDELEYPQRRQETVTTSIVPPPASTTSIPVSTTTPTSSPISTTSTSSSIPSSSSTLSTTSSVAPTIPSTTSNVVSTPVVSTTTPTTTSRQLSTRPDGGIVTLTLTTTGDTPTQTSSGGSSNGFFQNTAAVAAVFTIAGIIGLVLFFVLVTTCLRRRRERKFDSDVAEAAAAAAAATANPFFEDEEERGGAHWDPRRTSAQAGGYGKIGEDPYAYVAGGGVGGAAAGFARNNTNHYQQRNPQDAYSMNDMGSSGHPSSGYSHYSPAGNSYYAEQPQIDYSRPSFGSNVPGIAGVGSGGAMAVGAQQYSQDNQNLRYRGQQPSNLGVEDAYGGYTTTAASTSDESRYPNPYASQPSGTSYSQSPARRSTNASPPLPAIPSSNSPPPPPSYTGHGNPLGNRPEKARPMSANQNAMQMPPSQPAPLAPGTPDETWNDGGRILRVANE